MKTKLFGSYCLLVLAALIFAIFAFLLIPQHVSHIDLSKDTGISLMGTHERINILNNAFYNWKISALVAGLASIFSHAFFDFEDWILVLETTLFLNGLMLLFKHQGANWLNIILLAPALMITILICSGYDQVILGTFTFWPFLVLSSSMLLSSNYNTHSKQVMILLFALSAALQINAAGILAPLSVLFALFTAFAINAEKGINNHRLPIYLVIALLFTTIIPFLSKLEPSLPAYPSYAHVVPDDGLPGYQTPLIGPFLPLQIINTQSVSQVFAVTSVLLIIFCLPYLILKKPSFFAKTTLFLAICLTADCALTPGIAEIAPLSALKRLLPGYIFLPLTGVAFAAALVSLGLASTRKLSLSLIFSSLALSLCLTSSTSLLAFEATRTIQEFDSLHLSDAMRSKYEVNRRVLFSPSFNVIKSTGLHILDSDARTLKTSFQHLKPSDFAFFSTSALGADMMLDKILDGRASTRWTSGSGKQVGSEYIEFMLQQPLYIRGLQLDTGNFNADFPRSLSIEAAKACSLVDNKLAAEYKIVYAVPSWEGAIEYSEDGFPYFGGQQDVSMQFNSSQLVQCLRIKQTGQTPSFDWSVAELKFLLP